MRWPTEGTAKTHDASKNSAHVLIWVNNTTGCEVVNYEYLEFLGVGEGEALGYGWTQFIHPEDREDCFNAYLEAFSRRARFEADLRLRRRGGDYRWMRLGILLNCVS